MHADQLKVLLVGESRHIIGRTRKQLIELGHAASEVSSGFDAPTAFGAQRPDLVIVDACAPMNEIIHATSGIKAEAADRMVSIWFLVPNSSPATIARALEAGADDALVTPLDISLLAVKLASVQRVRRMHHDISEQRDQIALSNQHLVQEQKAAKGVFDKIAPRGCLDAKNIRHLMSPLSVFNGDILLAAMTPTGSMYVFIGDFTGHGLPAAIGTMPLADVFYGMSPKGFGLAEIVKEINQKLRRILPVGFFCCAAMLEINFLRKSLEVWSGGLPPGMLVQRSGVTPIVSNHVPLGVLPPERFRVSTHKFDMADGDRVLFWSDGILEATNLAGEQFGQNRLDEIFAQNHPPEKLFDEVRDQVRRHLAGSKGSDDLTMLEVQMMPLNELEQSEQSLDMNALGGARAWSFSYELKGFGLRDLNPIPLLLTVILETPGIRPHHGQIYTLLTEMYSNALEHGILGLNSRLKSTAQGFAAYYEARKQSLAQLTDQQCVSFSLEHVPNPGGGILRVKVRDTGPGFDHLNHKPAQPDPTSYCGRGIPLMLSLCERVEFAGCGNAVEVDFVWRRPRS